MGPRISDRVGAIAESATLAITVKAKALKAAGEPVIGFGAGEPDFPTPQHIVDAAIAACSDPANHKYTPASGLPELREAVATKTMRDSGFSCEASNVIITNGGKQAVANAFAVLCDPGDEVLVPTPYWTTYPEAIALTGASLVPVFASFESGWKVTVDQLEAAYTDRTKAMLFVSPSNPTGAIYSRDEIEAIGRWAVEKDIWVITDEIYEHLVYGDHEHHSMPVVVPELKDKTLILNGVAKTYAMTGWRVGWMIGPNDIIKATGNLQSHVTSNVNNVAQRAALAAVTGPLDAVDEMRSAFDRRRKNMFGMLSSVPGIDIAETEGAFYAYPSFERILGSNIKGHQIDTTLDLAAALLDDAKVAIVPGEAFGLGGAARLSFALGDDDLGEGVQRIVDFLS
ncbi:MAG: pyridoxal phosphate-dependent aminotransferase [Acidimicrobiia bacterium]|nr:pyridoxal phosphate-dependent aminotransferase [Acidimicrobiia bacterium]